MNEPRDSDFSSDAEPLVTAWRAQTAALAARPLAELRAAARAVEHRIVWRNRLETAAGVLGLCGWALVLVIAGGVVVLWQLHRRAGLRRLPPPALGGATLPFHRAELLRQRDAMRSVGRWYLAPLVPGFIVSAWGMARHVPASQPGLFLLVAAALFVAVIVLNRRGAAQLQRQIDALDAMADATVTR
jgi:hypothetical protein